MAIKHRSASNLISDNPLDTINNVSSVLAFLNWTECGTHDLGLDGPAQHGRVLILDSCIEAIQSLSGKVAPHG